MDNPMFSFSGLKTKRLDCHAFCDGLIRMEIMLVIIVLAFGD